MNQSSPYNSSVSKSKRKRPLGQILSEAGLISAHQIELALNDQIANPTMKIGNIFALRGWIDQRTADFFVEKWPKAIDSPQKHPLVYYFRKAALLSEKQIDEILEERNNSPTKVRFHQVAVKKGLIKQETVDFFVRNLLTSSQLKKPPGAETYNTPYELLTDYIRGETNFERSQLKKIKLNYVTLKGVNLNQSNLAEAELKQANLSNSSLKLVNLANANLEKAILKDVDFENACLSQVNFTDAHLEGSNFTAANLQAADLRDGYFVNVCFAGADLRRTKLQGANLKGASYSSQTFFDRDFDPEEAGMKLVSSEIDTN